MRERRCRQLNHADGDDSPSAASPRWCRHAANAKESAVPPWHFTTAAILRGLRPTARPMRTTFRQGMPAPLSGGRWSNGACDMFPVAVAARHPHFPRSLQPGHVRRRWSPVRTAAWAVPCTIMPGQRGSGASMLGRRHPRRRRSERGRGHLASAASPQQVSPLAK